jgi:hypothetical protein
MVGVNNTLEVFHCSAHFPCETEEGMCGVYVIQFLTVSEIVHA